MNMNYEEAINHYKDQPRPSLDEFIKHGKEHFVFLEMLGGSGWILQAIEIAEQLKEVNK